MNLSNVSKTAIATLRSRVEESQKSNALIKDPMAKFCLERLVSRSSADEKAVLFDKKISPNATQYIALRTRKYDAIINDFVSKHAGSSVVNLGCGFDTRFWRIQHEKCRYVELDLPEIVALKRDILGKHLAYELMPCSVLDPAWIEKVTSHGNRHVLLVAEGLFMYLPKQDVMNLFKIISETFFDSQIVLEVVTEKYTRGFWKKIVIVKMKGQLGYDAGAFYSFGVKNAAELETYAKGIKIIDEWSYLEDPDIRPRILKYLGISRTQWTVSARIN